MTPPNPSRLGATLGLALGVCMAMASAPALADDITYSFSGTVFADSGNRGFLGFAGSFTFGSLAIDQDPAPNEGRYFYNGLPYAITVTLSGGPQDGTVVTLSHQLTATVRNDINSMFGPSDEFSLDARNALGNNVLSLFLFDTTGVALHSDALPTPPGGLQLSNFDSNLFEWGLGGVGTLRGTVTDLQCVQGCAPIPEPSTWALMGAGLLALGAWHRRRPSLLPAR